MNSRWSHEQVTRNGEPVSIRAHVSGDLEILQVFGRHGTLLAKDVCDYTQRSYNAVIHRLQKLKSEPARLITVHKTQLDNPRMWQTSPQAFHLTRKGETILQEIGVQPRAWPDQHFAHSVAQSQVSLAFEIAARMNELEYVQLNAPNIEVNGHKVIPDLAPIGLGRKDHWRFTVVEIDCGTEQLRHSTKDKQTIQRKFAAYLNVLSQRLYQTAWDIPNCTVLFTTTTKTRLDSMRELLRSMTDNYLNAFKFFVVPTITMGNVRPQRGWPVTQLQLAPQ